MVEKLKQEEFMKFYTSLKNAIHQNERGCYLSLENPEYYQETRNFIVDDGVGGFAITKEGDLIAVHKNPAIAQIRGGVSK